MTDTGAGTGAVPADTGAMTQWAAEEEGSFQQIEITAQADAQRHAKASERLTLWRRWGGRRRTTVASTTFQADEDEASFAAQMEKDIASGDIAPPPGGLLTPEEIHEVEMNPWPGHTMAEAVERLRAQRATEGDGPPAV